MERIPRNNGGIHSTTQQSCFARYDSKRQGIHSTQALCTLGRYDSKRGMSGVIFFKFNAHTAVMWNEKSLQPELVKIRRYLHKHAEVGFHLEKTNDFICKKLTEYGYRPQPCGRAGIVATVGKSGKTFLLRADTDGLPIPEQTGLSYACTTGQMHACGHDMHTAMLLGAAKLLKIHEKELRGRVKLLFQPAEELLEGAKEMIENGVLDNPKPNAAMMIHVLAGTPLPAGTAVVAKGVSAPAADYFTITVQGKGCHGAAPWNGVDALTVAARILLGLEELSAREISVANTAVLTVGKIECEGADNAISDRVALKGTLRSFDEDTRKTIKKRMEAIARYTAKGFRATAEVAYGGGCPTLVNDEGLALHTERVFGEYFGTETVYNSTALGGDVRAGQGGSEDFAYFTHKIPSVMVAISAGGDKAGSGYPLHHPKVVFEEGILAKGATMYALNAYKWLQNAEKIGQKGENTEA